MANITTGCNSVLIKDIVERCENVYECDKYFDRDDWCKVYVNGALVGLTCDPQKLYEELEELRDISVFSNQVSFYFEDTDHEIRIFCDHGRFMRPVLRVKDNKLLLSKDNLHMSWNELLENDIVRYIDCNEVENSLIAMTPDDLIKYPDQSYKYCEIHPSAMLGVCSAVIPYPEHNQSPRLVYQSSMVKQALGVYALSFKQRFDTVVHVMHYPQKPLVSTKFDKMLKYDEMLTGCNPIVAIATYGGWNQEDSVMLNKSSVDRGMFVHTCYKTLLCEENKKTNCSFEKIEVPPSVVQVQNKNSNYSKLGENGIVRKGVPVYKGDIIIGKTLTKVQKDEKEEKTDCSLAINNGEEGIVDEIWEGINEEGYKMVKIRIRQLRTPEIGDKFASRSSQKGVCGLLLRQEDMPFTSQGITPDIIINPHCFTADSMVSLYNGLTRPIIKLKEGEHVWSYEDGKGMLGGLNVGMELKGFEKVMKLTLFDGREIKCTPDHKFMCIRNEKEVLVEAKDIVLNEDEIVMGFEGTEDINYGDEDNWKLVCDNITYSCDTPENREKSMAFARILGYVLTDGCVCYTRNEYKCNINFGSLIDAEICLKDIYLLSGKTPKLCINTNNNEKYNTSTYVLNLPSEISKNIANLEGITAGRRTRQETVWPEFLFRAPKSIIREFLGGLFGGDGHSPYIRDKHVIGVKFSESIVDEFKQCMEDKMQKLCELLNMFQCDAKIERIRKYSNEKGLNFLSFYINVANSHNFSKYIGFRYCTQKIYRLSIYKSYKDLQEKVKEQSKTILELFKQFHKTTTNTKALELAREKFLENNVPLNTYYSLSSVTQISNKLKNNRSKELLHFDYDHFPTFQEYISILKCSDWFSNYVNGQEATHLKTFRMKLLDRKDIGEENVYCIGVQNYHRFFVSSALVKNCMPSRMTMSQLIETLLGKTSSLSGDLGDATAFSTGSINPIENISKQLEKFGFDRYGNERLYCGYTGEMMDAEIFIGPVYYQRLKHLVADKLHSRSRGNVTMMHHQPSEGRSRDGGLRTGVNISLVIVQISTLC